MSGSTRDFRRWFYFQLDRLQIPRRERRWIPLLLLLNLAAWSINLYLDHPHWVDPALLAAEEAQFKELFQKSYLEHRELSSRYGVDLPPLRDSSASSGADPGMGLEDRAANPDPSRAMVPDASSRGDPSGRSPGSASESGLPVDLNTADEIRLQALPGIGPSYAERIVQWRNKNGPFTSLEQLLNVKGIGEKRLERLRPHLRLTEAPADSTTTTTPVAQPADTRHPDPS